jgi:hypothetical protein
MACTPLKRRQPFLAVLPPRTSELEGRVANGRSVMVDNQTTDLDVRMANGRSKRTETRAILYDIAMDICGRKDNLLRMLL